MTSTLSHNQPDSTRHPTLFVGGTLLASLGLAFAIAAVVAPDFLLTLYRLAAAPSTHVDLGSSARFATGIYGGLMVGWGVMLVALARGQDVLRSAALGVLAWWVVDSAASIATGFPWNVASNALFLVPFLPVLASLLPRRPAGAIAVR